MNAVSRRNRRACRAVSEEVTASVIPASSGIGKFVLQESSTGTFGITILSGSCHEPSGANGLSGVSAHGQFELMGTENGRTKRELRCAMSIIAACVPCPAPDRATMPSRACAFVTSRRLRGCVVDNARNQHDSARSGATGLNTERSCEKSGTGHPTEACMANETATPALTPTSLRIRCVAAVTGDRTLPQHRNSTH